MLEKEKQWLLEEKYNGEKCEAFFTDLKKLEDGVPLAFLIGHIDFINTKINLEFKPLIPRPETEF
jgi:methylase of polypeptide subunit release factors